MDLKYFLIRRCEMTHEEIKFEEIKNKILNDFVPVLKAYGEFKKIDINDSNS